ncbi:uncharacterized protein LOC124258566 [Haliotis rubra]|uniref:uncharacterized protein LOC124258566 n=1 Tax=Haliotis rubra TaxID=36100 RepID=UPI001EE5ADF6|nr:uncharacterized protein LOC124258566 [Haliotis rubra]
MRLVVIRDEESVSRLQSTCKDSLSMAEKETFESWLTKQGFTDSSINKLTKEEFTNSSELLELDKSDIESLNLKLAQRKLLEKVIKSLQKAPQPSEPHNTPSAPVTTGDLAKDSELNQLLESLGSSTLQDVLNTEHADHVARKALQEPLRLPVYQL